MTHDLLDAVTGIGVGWHMVPISPGAPSIYNMTIRMADTTPYFGLQCNPFNGGAALIPEHARLAALGEAAERYCSSLIEPERIRFGSYRELAVGSGASPLHPSEIGLFHPCQAGSLPTEIFSETTCVSWVEGRSLLTGKQRLVPACLVFIPYSRQDPSELVIGPSISTGMACGPDLDWVLLSGLCEYIERDAFALHWFTRQSAPRLLLDEPWIESLMRNRFQRPNLDYLLYVMETDLAFPTIICFIRDRNFSPAMISIGGACRPDVREGTEKALVEAVQGWAWGRHIRLEEGSTERPESFDVVHDFDDRVELYARCDMTDALEFLFEEGESVRLSDFSRDEAPKRDAIGKALASIRAAGSEAVYVDLTLPEIESLGLLVGKVYCPKLQQIEGDFRFPLLGGGRVEQVPVKLGWRQTPVDPTKLNPFPHPYP